MERMRRFAKSSFRNSPVPTPPDDLELAYNTIRVPFNDKGPVPSPSLPTVAISNKPSVRNPRGIFRLLNGPAGKSTTANGPAKILDQHEKTNGHAGKVISPKYPPSYAIRALRNHLHERTVLLEREILKVLEEFNEEIHQGEDQKWSLSANIYMIGTSETTAIPTVLISGRKNPRKKALKLLNEKKIMESFHDANAETGKKVRLMSSSDPPIPRQAASGSGMQIMELTHHNTKVFYDRNVSLRVGYAVQVYSQSRGLQGELLTSKSTIGCILTSGSRYFAWTSGHSFLGPSELKDQYNQDEWDDNEIEFEFDEKYGYEEVDDGPLASGEYHPQHPTRAEASKSNPDIQSQPSLSFHQDSTNEIKLEELGFLYWSSVDVKDSGKDWALIEITAPSFKTASTISIVNIPIAVEGVISLPDLRISSRKQQVKVSLLTARGALQGSLSATSVFITIPPSTKFQEFWIVALDNGEKIEKGDCGSSVIGSGGVMYGHLVSGDLARGIGHIVPFSHSILEMRAVVGQDLKLTSTEQLQSLDIPAGSAASEHDIAGVRPVEVSELPNIQTTQLDSDEIVPTPHTEEQSENVNTGLSWKPAKLPIQTSKSSGNPQRSRIVMEERTRFQPRSAWSNKTSTAVSGSNIQPTSHLTVQEKLSLLKWIDQRTIDWRVLRVACAGILAASYALSVSNVIMPSLAFIYWPANATAHANQVRLTTQVGMVVGALACGHASDLFGRRQIYGLGLTAIFLSTLGTVQASAGYHDATMSFLGWLLFWRLVLGVGIGAVFVSAAVMAAEFAPTKLRATMLAVVFLMQPLGQMLASVIGLIVLVSLGRARNLDTDTDLVKAAATADIMWRITVAVGAIPTILGLLIRMNVPESIRYMFGSADPRKAVAQTVRYYYGGESFARRISVGPIEDRELEVRPTPFMSENRIPLDLSLGMQDIEGENTRFETPWASNFYTKKFSVKYSNRSDNPDDHPKYKYYSIYALRSYFKVEGNWRQLASISISGLFLNIAFSLLGTSDYRNINNVWTTSLSAQNHTTVIEGQATTSGVEANIYNAMFASTTRSLIIVSAASVVGGLLVLGQIHRYRRRRIFHNLSLLFACFLIPTGVAMVTITEQRSSPLLTFYTFSIVFFNFGISFLLFMIPAEIFPTPYRGTGCGIAFASGGIGSIIGEAILGTTTSLRTRGYYIGVSSVLVLLAALLIWIWLPAFEEEDEFPHSRKLKFSPKTLEKFGEGRSGQEPSGYEKHRFRQRLMWFKKKLTR